MAAVSQGRGNAFAAGTLGLLLALHCFTWHASATTWTVGDSSGWNVGVDYTTWASGKTFKTGDVLFFPYTKAEHNVVVVGKSGYDSCSAANPVATFTDGNTNVTLNASGTQYYLCSVVGHCSGGMKLAVTVVAAGGAAPAPAPAPSTTTKAPPAPAPSTTTKAPPPSVVSSPTPSSSPASTPASVETPASAPTPSPSLASAPASVETPSSAPTPAGPTTPSPSTTPPPSSAPLAPPPSSAPSLPTTAALAAALGLAATLLAL